jgi:hypothetical protein
MKVIAERVEKISAPGYMTELQKSAFLDTYKLELGIMRLYARDPALYEELSKDIADRKNDCSNWGYDLDPQGIPIIFKKLKKPFGPDETATHRFGELPGGGFGWIPKQARDQGGKFKS